MINDLTEKIGRLCYWVGAGLGRFAILGHSNIVRKSSRLKKKPANCCGLDSEAKPT